MFQHTVNRQYTTGFPGEIVRDGPLRANPARIASVSVGADPAASTNRISRVFGYSADMPVEGLTLAAMEAQVVVGGPNYFGVLFHPKHYTLYGTVGNTLGASLDLPFGTEAEFANMAILIAEVFNQNTAVKAVGYGDLLAYVPNNITTANNPQALPYGALVSYTGALPAGLVAIPNAKVLNPISLAASAAGAVVSGYTIIQLT